MRRPHSTQNLLFPEFVPRPDQREELNAWLDPWIANRPVAVQDTDLALARVETPLGPMVAAASAEGLALLEFAELSRVESQLAAAAKRHGAAIARGGARAPQDGHLAQAKSQIADYFAGARREFDLTLATYGTQFQEEVWRELRKIPYGARRTYGEIAIAMGSVKASRAVGSANGINPISIVQPCHRVVGSDGTLTGYGGGLWRKRRLLELEAS